MGHSDSSLAQKCSNIFYDADCKRVEIEREREASDLVLGDELAPPLCVWHVVDGQSQVVSAVFEVQSLGFIQQLSAHLRLHLQHLLQPADNKEPRPLPL